MKNYILDTNIFFNFQVDLGLGKNPEEVMATMTHYAKRLREAGAGAFYMPPNIVEELHTFVSSEEPSVRDFFAEITIKAPEKSGTSFSAEVFYELVQDIRHRSYRGLQIAEEELANAVKGMSGMSADVPRQEYQKAIGEHVARLRDRYRNATRAKFLDSVADLDIIVLARELHGTVVSVDEGVIQWARKFGVQEVAPNVFKKQLDSLLQA